MSGVRRLRRQSRPSLHGDTASGVAAAGELRQDPVTRQWVVVAPDRAQRPGASARADLDLPTEDELLSCPFCEGREGRTPPETFRLGAGTPDTPGWTVRVVPNLYPVFEHHEVVVSTPRHVRSFAELTEHEQVVRAKFSLPYVVCAGSHTLCGCGFTDERGDWLDERDPDELAASLASSSRLVAYLREHSIRDLYACWSGDEGEPVESERQISVEALLAPEFAFKERERLILVDAEATARE